MRLLAIAAAAALSLAVSTAAYATPETAPQRDCFASSNWEGWSAPGNSNVILIGVGRNDVFRVELTEGTQVRERPSYFLVNRVRGSAWICSPLDLQLTLADQFGFERPLIAQSLRKLSAEEVAALSPEDRPN